MRDLILLAIVLPGGLLALRYPFVGAMLWTWVSVMNPHRMTYGFMFTAPVAMFIGLCLLIGLLMTKERRGPFLGAPVSWFVALIAWMCITTLFAFDRAGSLIQLEKVLKIDLMILVVLMLVRTKREMIAFAWVFTLSVVFFGFKGGIFTLLSGGYHHVLGPSGSYIQENNALAVALIMAIPMLRFLQTTLEHAWQKNAMTIVMILCGVSILGSQSRGALLGVSAMLALLWWRGKNKLGTAVVLAVCSVVFLSFMPDAWWERMGTIRSFEEDRSAMGRINAWWMTFNLAKDNFFGGGFSIYNEFSFGMYAPDPTFIVSAHSIYFHMLGEHGFVGLFIYLAFWIATWISAGWLRKNGRKQAETEWCSQLGSMIQVSLVGFAVGGAFLSLTYFDLPYNMMAVTVAARVWVQSRGWENEKAVSQTRRFLGIPLFLGDRIRSSKSTKLQQA